jgi:hypothetical protein
MAPPSTAARAWSRGTITNLYWLMFNRVDGLRVTGNGLLDGSGQSWWVRRCHSDASVAGACVESAPTVRNIARIISLVFVPKLRIQESVRLCGRR